MRVFDLPGLPFTESDGGADLVFLYDEDTCHGRLETFYPQHHGQKMGSSHYLQRFGEFARKWLMWESVVDIGGNDGELGKILGADSYRVIDGDGGIEKATLPEGCSFISSHTIEHLRNPEVLVAKVSKVLTNGYFALQLPSLDLLVADHRFDQVFHGHYHYFSERSVTALLSKHGLKVVAKEWNTDHWGALMLICEKGEGQTTGRRITSTDIRYSRFMFRMQMTSCREYLKDFVCYGASQMLPVLGYYLPINKAEFIADDKKNPKDLRGRDVLITSASKMTARILTAKAFEAGARNVLVPFNQL